MSLLRGLAERALGTARPVRSQHAGPLRTLHRDASVTEPLAPAPETASMAQMPAGGPSHATHAQPHAATTAEREAPTDMAVETNIPPLVVAHRAEHDATPPMRAMPEATHRAEATPQAPRISTRDVSPPAQAFASMPDPEPLVTRRAPQPRESPPPRNANAITPHRERQPAHAAVLPSPTEVHVSIGRVELTALAPAPTPRAARPRDSNTRGLSDYLRGPRGTL